ncbi:MAG: MHS family MFS transporter [Alphaproteobacteria bacterium]|nr:MHS family MFS transporter [Alphaproteobacteria bacterium]
MMKDAIDEPGGSDTRPTEATPRTIFACTIGNVLEWYDFTAYGFLAVFIGSEFFPSSDPVASLLAAFGVLAAGYAARPIGSVIYGHLGDRRGRKPTMILAMSIMGVATVLIGLLPTYTQIGVAAAVLLVLLRVAQGISVAGEYSSSAVLLVEKAPSARRGFIGSWIAFGNLAGCLLGSGVASLTSTVLGDAVMGDWGWRLPFLFGGVIAVVGIVVRRRLGESPAMPKPEDVARSPVVEAVRFHWREILTIIGLCLPIAVGYFIIFVYAASYLTDQMHFTTAEAMDINTISLVALSLFIPITGLCSDLIGRKPVLFIAQIGTVILAWPMWSLMHEPALGMVLLGQTALAVINGMGWAMTIPVMIEFLPAKVRCSGAGIGYNLCLGIFGGTTPWVATYLVQRTGDAYAPIYYLIAAALISCGAVLSMREMARRPLPA